ncbi:uncharacterized protein J3D65DRAFT_671608 [Phyllosticta citribraziliensis]|uniref:Uncharacterized protein n=1 Tax=Phyllosticta citribraziliensis TaxID=989973 RepID=A0ABR1L5Y3_9PEZI
MSYSPCSSERFGDLDNPSDKRVSELYQQVRTQISEKIDEMSQAFCDHLADETVLPDRFELNMTLLKEGIAISEDELLRIDNNLGPRRSEVERLQSVHRQEMEKLVSDTAREKVNFAFIASSVGSMLCDQINQLKRRCAEVEEGDMGRDGTVDERGQRIRELESEITKLREDLEKEKDMVKKVLNKYTEYFERMSSALGISKEISK